MFESERHNSTTGCSITLENPNMSAVDVTDKEGQPSAHPITQFVSHLQQPRKQHVTLMS